MNDKTNGWMDGWKRNEWINERISEWTNVLMNERMYVWMNECMDEHTNTVHWQWMTKPLY